MFSKYLVFFLLSFLLSVLFTVVVKKKAIKWGVVDRPNQVRKIHQKEIPLLGGLAVFLSFFLVLWLAKGELLIGNLRPAHWLGFFIGGVFLMIGGFVDDKYNLTPAKQLFWPLLAIFSVILGGVGIEKISNPFGGFVYLKQFSITFLNLGELVLWSDLLVLFWLLGMMYTTKILDGLDGLVTGVSSIGALVIFLFTMTTKYYQPDIGLASLIFAGSCLGFLVFNWNPAKIFLGEGGSLLMGYVLGVFSIISGGKIAMALLVMGIPILDVAWTILRRLIQGKNPFKSSDKKHLHHRLLDLGLGQKGAVLFFYALSAVFGLSGLFLQSKGKILALVVLFFLMAIITGGFILWDYKKEVS